ncbi:YgaP family membrane protein [Dictyoglomus thermophilum]|uniref:Membrane protein, putative n=2 Tax=Dictyoglomus thermophilum TaxID=14 RepID=B5YCG8_DICT6|nr:DUF2892 domain-containing protein [Dictyoglomus thermophilum]ACI19318.1 membrane protein, putative [Dictyoglomus thermophilum H-6-12]MCX7720092.1 DUF2892 domain-containing protein [Dictyoglomus thermophilum]TYT23433.1 DUF2892 domain-containing protein [Dictyoglomus thermophilum]
MNVGKTDAIIRVIIGLILPHLTKWGVLSGTAWAVILHIIGTILVFTAAIRYCPLYRLINKSTAK